MTEGKIKLIQIIADSSLGGGPRHVLGLIKNIDKDAFDVYIICPHGYLSAEAKQLKDVEVFNVSMRSKFDLFSLWKIFKIINKIRVDSGSPFGPIIIHTHGPRAGLLGRLASPVKAKKVHTEHLLDENYHLKNPINEWIQKRLLRAQNYRSDRIIAVSSSVKSFLVKNKLAPTSKTVVIPNGIDLQATSCHSTSLMAGKLQTTNKTSKAPIIGTVGNLNYQKGHIYLIQAMPEVLSKYPLATLEIIGEGEERPVLEAEIRKLKLEKHITLLGHKNVVNKYYKHWSVFVLPSISESFGIVILEAMNQGLPIVASRVGGTSDIITQRKNGILIEPENTEQLARSILEILDNPALAAKFKREGLDRVKDFDWKKIIKRIEKEFTELFERN